MITNSVIKAAAATLLTDGLTISLASSASGSITDPVLSRTAEGDYKTPCSYRASMQWNCATYVVSGG